MSEEEYIPGQIAADMLQVSERTVQRYATGPSRRIRSQKYTGSKKLFYHRGDVERLADELGATRTAEVVSRPKQDMMPAGAMLDYLRVRDQELQDAQRALTAALIEVGQARKDAERRQLIDTQLQEITTERDSLRHEVNRIKLRSTVKTAVIILLVIFLAILVGLFFYLK